MVADTRQMQRLGHGSQVSQSSSGGSGPRRGLGGRLATVSTVVVLLLVCAAVGTIWRYELALSHSDVALRSQADTRDAQRATTFFWREREAMNEYLLRPSPRLLGEVALNQRGFEESTGALKADRASEGTLLQLAVDANRAFVKTFERRRGLAGGGSQAELSVVVQLNAAEAGVLAPLDALEANSQDEVLQRQAAARTADIQALIAAVVGAIVGMVATAGLALYSRRLLREAALRRRSDADTAAAQREFADALHNSDSVEEADELLRRQLERSITASHVVVLRRNNSDNRLEAATAPGPDLVERLEDAEPRSCLAVRLGGVHEEGGDRTALLRCGICGDTSSYSTCHPLLVAGEVIGSALVSHPEPLEDAERVEIANSVGQAGPVLANLRNLSLAEFRAATDALTGLPNNRAVQDTLKRMVAHASRTLSPLTAIMLDLDHFKQINDKHGHGRGDDVLAAVGSVLEATLRSSDFVGRYGGEEFVILLPDTGREEGAAVAEKIRLAVEATVMPDIAQPITASLGLAVLPDDAGDSATLLRHADRLLYAAKANGRNRVEAHAAARLESPPQNERRTSAR
jgi:diguanylate cyclase (GGDEF)-like protein